jgi:hypothetical protein
MRPGKPFLLQVEKVLGLKQPEEPAQETEPYIVHDCGHCGGRNTVVKEFDNVYNNDKLGLTLTVPAHICSQCDSVVYEPTDFQAILQKEEDASGRPYVRVSVKNGRINRTPYH